MYNQSKIGYKIVEDYVYARTKFVHIKLIIV